MQNRLFVGIGASMVGAGCAYPVYQSYIKRQNDAYERYHKNWFPPSQGAGWQHRQDTIERVARKKREIKLNEDAIAQVENKLQKKIDKARNVQQIWQNKNNEYRSSITEVMKKLSSSANDYNVWKNMAIQKEKEKIQEEKNAKEQSIKKSWMDEKNLLLQQIQAREKQMDEWIVSEKQKIEASHVDSLYDVDHAVNEPQILLDSIQKEN